LNDTLNIIHTQECIAEMGTDGHAPVKFLCSDGHVYYCKYRLNEAEKRELDFLYYELAGHVLLRQLGIPSPEVAFVRITRDSFQEWQMPRNARHMKPGVVAFGSQQVLGDIVDDFVRFPKAKDLDRIIQPEDLLRIAFFDLWTGNTDRGKALRFGHNYNVLLASEGNRQRFLPVDHAFLFGGQAGLRAFTPGHYRPTVDNSLFRTPVLLDVVRHLGADKRNEVLNAFFLTSLPRTRPNELVSTLRSASSCWPWPPGFPERMTDFLWDPDRLRLVETEARSFIHQLP